MPSEKDSLMKDQKSMENMDEIYARKSWIWILMGLIFLFAAVAVVALILPFLFSPSFPNGYNVYNVSTETVNSGTTLANSGNINASNRILYIFNPPTSVPTTVTRGSLSLQNVRLGMMFAVGNRTSVPLTVTAGTTAPVYSGGRSFASKTSSGGVSYCIPGEEGSLTVIETTHVIPPNGTFFFVSHKDGELSLIQSTPINVVASGVQGTDTPCT